MIIVKRFPIYTLIERVYILFAIILALKSMNFYYLNYIHLLPLQLIVIASGILLLQGKPFSMINDYSLLIIVLIVNFIFTVLKDLGIGSIISFIMILLLCFQDDQLKEHLLALFTKTLSIILLISLITYLPNIFGLHLLPTISIQYDGRLFNFDYLCLYSNVIPPRFQGLFVEPGHVGMIIAMTLFCRGYDMKDKFNRVLLLSLILSFSLSGYVLVVLGYIMYAYFDSNISFKTILVICFCCGVFALLAIKQEDNIFYQLIFKRLEFEGGNISGNNRYEPRFENFYELHMRNPQYLWFGMQDKFDISNFANNAGYKIYLIQNGIISLIFLLIKYATIATSKLSSKGIALLALYCFSFIQRPYAEWFIMYLLFICALPFLKSGKQPLQYSSCAAE